MGLELATPHTRPSSGALQGLEMPHLAAGGSRLHARLEAGGRSLSVLPTPPGDSCNWGRGQALSALVAPWAKDNRTPSHWPAASDDVPGTRSNPRLSVPRT